MRYTLFSYHDLRCAFQSIRSFWCPWLSRDTLKACTWRMLHAYLIRLWFIDYIKIFASLWEFWLMRCKCSLQEFLLQQKKTTNSTSLLNLWLIFKPRSHCPGLRCRFTPVWWSGMNRDEPCHNRGSTVDNLGDPGWTVLNRVKPAHVPGCFKMLKTTGTHRE